MTTNYGEIVIPEIKELVKNLQDHPRLLCDGENFARIKKLKNKDNNLKRWLKNTKRKAVEIMEEPAVEYNIPDGRRLLSISRKVLNRIMHLALLYRLEDDNKYGERLWQEIEAAGNFNDWNPSHFLDTAEMTNAFAIAYDWLYDYWNESQKKFIKKAIIKKGLKEALPQYRNKSGFPVFEHNWNTVCNGGIALGALAILDEEEKLAGEIIQHVLKSVPEAIAETAPDGGYPEGPTYWNYGIRYTVYLLSSLQTAFGTDFSLGKIGGLSETGYFPLYMQGPGTSTFNFADASQVDVAGPQLHWLAHYYNKPVFAAYQLKMQPEGSPFDVIWYEPGDYQGLIEQLPEQRLFTGKVPVASFRSCWQDDALFIGVKGGDNQANHGDLDIGTFVLDACGVRWACDLGRETYDIPGYWNHSPEGGRWNYYRKRAEGHNTLLINPSEKWNQDPMAKAEIEDFQVSSAKASAVVDMTSAYAHLADSVRRKVIFKKNEPGIILEDSLQLKNKSEIWWFMHTTADIELIEQNRAAILKKDQQKLSVKIIDPAEAVFSIREAKPLPVSPDPAEARENKGVKKLAINLKEIKGIKIVVAMELLR